MEDNKELSEIPFQLTSELPHCVVSNIFSNLRMKEIVRTSILSKRWVNEWKSIKRDLNFDAHNMFDIQEIEGFDYYVMHSLPRRVHGFFYWLNSEFIRRVDHLMLPEYQGAKIHSLKVDFPLGDMEKNAIDRWILQGVAKGVERIELLFSNKKFVINFDPEHQPYKFFFILLLGCTSIKFLHLQNCFLAPPPFEFPELEKLTTLVLERLIVTEDMLHYLFFGNLQLEDLTFNECSFMSNLNINSQTLCHLTIIECERKHSRLWKINVDTLNLSYFEYRGCFYNISSIKAPRLFKLYMDSTNEGDETERALTLIQSLPHVQNLAICLTGNSKIVRLPEDFGPFQHLGQLELFHNERYMPEVDLLWVLDIVMACPRLQKFSLVVINAYLFSKQRQRREHTEFSHNELKYVELHGCAGNINEIELASHFLRNVTSLEQITFGHCGKFYMGAGRWVNLGYGNSTFFSSWRNLIHEMLNDEVTEQIRLVVL